MIKNYTSGVSVDKTVARIEAALVAGAASNISKQFKDGALVALCFTTVEPSSMKPITIQLPANVEGVFNALWKTVKKPHTTTKARLLEQAERTAWKLLQDWVEVQMSMVQMRQAEFLQVFLPYVWNGRQTLFASVKEGGFRMLAAHREIP